MALSIGVRSGTRDEVLALHPELPFAMVAGLGWALVALAHARGWPHGSSAAALAACLAMTAAMMAPTALPAARRVALDGVWTRRRRGPALFLSGYLVVWISFGAIMFGALAVVPGAAALTPVALAGAAVWELTPGKREFVRSCQRVPAIAPRGRAADRGCAAAGLTSGYRCIGGCGVLMLATYTAGHSLGPMLLVSGIVYAQKLRTDGVRLLRPAAALLGLAALLAESGLPAGPG
jgi:predicted metal-binding membrane protein